MFDQRAVVRGGGDLGSGVALRLWRCGFAVIILETSNPIAVRRTVAFSEAIYDGRATVEEAVARRAAVTDIEACLANAEIPVLVDPEVDSLSDIRPFALVDAILAKRNVGTRNDMAPFVVGLGPGFSAGESVHAVVETNRGPNLGRVIWTGEAEENTGEPAGVQGVGAARVLRAPSNGILQTVRDIGSVVSAGETVASVEGMPIRAPFASLVRGLARDGLLVREGMKIGDLDPRLTPEICMRVSDKSLSIAGGVLEAVIMRLRGETSE